MKVFNRIIWSLLLVGIGIILHSIVFREGYMMWFGIALGVSEIAFTLLFGVIAYDAMHQPNLFYEVKMVPGRLFNANPNELRMAQDRGYTHVRYLYDSGMKREIPIDTVVWDFKRNEDTSQVELV